MKVQKGSPEKHPCGCSLRDLYTFARASSGLRVRLVGYKGATAEDHLGFSDVEATADPNTWSLARVVETKPAGSRLQGGCKQPVSAFCCQGHGLERKRWRRRAASL